MLSRLGGQVEHGLQPHLIVVKTAEETAMRRNRVNWLNRVYYVTGWLLLVTFVGWFGLAYAFFREGKGVTVEALQKRPDYMAIVLGGVLLQLLAGIVVAYLGRRRLGKSKLMKGWREDRTKCIEEFDKAFSPEAKWPKEEIASLLLAQEMQKRLEADRAEETNLLKDELEKLVTSRRPEIKRVTTTPKPETSWQDVSKLLYKVGRLCKELDRPDLAEQVELQYHIIRRILKLDLVTSLANMTTSLLLFSVGFLAVNRFSAWLFGERVGLDWVGPVGFVVGGAFGTSLVYNGLQFLVRWFTEKSWTDLDDIFVGITSGPLTVFIMAAAIYWSLTGLPWYFKFYAAEVWSALTSDIVRRIIFIVVTAWLAIFVFDRVVIYLLRRWAERTEQKYDDMFVRIFQVFGEFLIVAVTIGVILTNFQPQIKEATGGAVDNILLPYSVLVSVFSAILGFASREAIENFFGGVLLQIDKPFEKGERLVLETGEICDVREIGMRSTILYNVIENTEISIPNSVMAAQKITNVSRPDWQLRIQVRLAIPHDGYSLGRAEEILLDIAYLEGEVDQLRVTRGELSPELERRNRKPVKEELKSLVQLYPQVMKTEISQIIGGGTFNNQPVFGPEEVRRIEAEQEWEINKALDRIANLRKQYTDQLSQSREKFIQIREKLGERLPVEIDGMGLERIIKEVVHRVIYETDEQEREAMLIEVLRELSKREGISEMVERQGEMPRTLGPLEEALASLSQLIATAHGKPPPTSPLDAIELIAVRLREQENVRLGILRKITDEVAWVANGIFTIADIYREARRDMDALISELGKEPTVHSRFVVSEEGRGYVEIDLNVYATHLERRFEVITKLNREIQRRFSEAGIRMSDLGSESVH